MSVGTSENNEVRAAFPVVIFFTVSPVEVDGEAFPGERGVRLQWQFLPRAEVAPVVHRHPSNFFQFTVFRKSAV